MTTRSTIRYAAKQAYKLALMRGIYDSTQCGFPCRVHESYVMVGDCEAGSIVPIAKAWASF